MKTSIIALAAPVIATAAHAQTPPDFAIGPSLPLSVTLNPSNRTITPGTLVSQQDTLAAPNIQAPKADDSAIYVALMIDSTFPVLHLLQPNLVASATNGTLIPSPSNNDTALVGSPYVPPQPPAGDGAHDYIILLYPQPDDWNIPANYSNINPPSVAEDVMGFDFADFVAASGLGDPVGANWWREVNETMGGATGSGMGAVGTASATVMVVAPTASADVQAQVGNGAAGMVIGGSGSGLMGLVLSLLLWNCAQRDG